MPENLARAIDDLTVEVRQLKKQVEGERDDRRAERKTDRRRMLLIFATGLVALLSLALWNRHGIQSSNRTFCDYIQSQSAAGSGSVDPPGTAGRRSADIAAQLYKDLGCAG